MDRCRALRLVFVVSVLSCCDCWDVSVPGSVIAVKGSCVMVPCRTQSHSSVVWYKYKKMGYPIVYSGKTSDILGEFRGRTSVPGYSSQGNCSLKIDNVRSEDNGVYIYPWIYPENSDPYKYIEIKVEDPRISISLDSTPKDGKLFSASCSVRHSCPSPSLQITWTGLTPLSNTLTITGESGGYWTSVARAEFMSTRQDHGKYLECKSDISSKKDVRLNVLYAPVNVKVDGPLTVDEGGTLLLTCNSESDPPPTEYGWFVTSERNPSKSKTLTLRDVRRNTSISCSVRNSEGESRSKTIQLNVHFPPTVLSDSVCLEKAGNMKCVCQAEAEPKASISWIVDGRDTPLSQYNTKNVQNGRITVSEMTGPLASSVSCKTSNRLKTTTFQMTVQLHPKAAPASVKIVGAERSVVEGENLTLTCSSDSYPPPTHYEWLITHQKTNTSHSAHKYETFTLRDVQRDTSVSCSVSNSVGRGQSVPTLLNVHFPPAILQESVCWEKAGSVYCECRVEAEPKANISWTTDGHTVVLPHFNKTTYYSGRIAISELTGPITGNVSCIASNDVGTKMYEIPVQHSLEGYIGLMAGVGAVAFVIFLSVGVAICLRNRCRSSSEDTSSSHTHRNLHEIKEHKTCEVRVTENIYGNDDATEGDIYANSTTIFGTTKDNDIYENY
ncbi:myelin-associated glycoprotein-like [Hoplias malabaricus]|uniref:myelin-associated glycoprotein-like n=1 Tax=Hoplias malabaricus TaxID=27720 RepID=UPI003461B52B